MVKCNECKSLNFIIENKCVKYTCTKHKVEVKITSKMFKDSINPCSQCSGKDYIKKEGLNLGKL